MSAVSARLTAEKSATFSEMWVQVKGWNREAGEPFRQSFLVEVMALELVRPSFDRYQEEVAAFLGNVIDRADGPWLGPAGMGTFPVELVERTSLADSTCDGQPQPHPFRLLHVLLVEEPARRWL